METIARTFTPPTADEVSESNQAIFADLHKKLGFVPNLYAYYAKNDHALKDYLQFQNRKTVLSAKEKEIINLVVSEYNSCQYCLSAHTAIAKMNGFDEDQIKEIRGGTASFHPKYDALAKLVRSTVENKGRATETAKEKFLEVGYTEAALVDVAMGIGEKTVSNFLHNLTGFEIDFPLAEPLS